MVGDGQNSRGIPATRAQTSGQLRLLLSRYYKVKIRDVAGTAIMLFVGVQDDDLTGIGSSFSAAIREALNAAQREADCIGVVTVGSVRHTGKASLYAVNVARGLDKPVFAALCHFELTADLTQDFRAEIYLRAGTASTVANGPHTSRS